MNGLAYAIASVGQISCLSPGTKGRLMELNRGSNRLRPEGDCSHQKVEVAVPTTLPRQASCWSAFCVASDKPLQLPHHEIHDVVRVGLHADASQVPDPGSRARVEPEQSFLGQRFEELDREERIAASLLAHQLRQRMGSIPLAV